MYNQGMNFDIENTTWWKQDGSDHFKVRSVFFDGTGMSIQTYDGRLINGDALRDYVQSETPVNPPQNPPIQKIDKSLLLQGITEDELGDVFSKPITNTQNQNQYSENPVIRNDSQSTNDIIIERMMKNLGYPEINFDIKITVTPEYIEKLKTSAQVMGVDMVDIKNFMCKYIKFEDIQNKLCLEFSKLFDTYFELPHTEECAESPLLEEKPDPTPVWFEDDSFNI